MHFIIIFMPHIYLIQLLLCFRIYGIAFFFYLHMHCIIISCPHVYLIQLLLYFRIYRIAFKNKITSFIFTCISSLFSCPHVIQLLLHFSIYRIGFKYYIFHHISSSHAFHHCFHSKMISNDQELIQSDPISCPINQKGNN